jgi:cell division protein FtsW
MRSTHTLLCFIVVLLFSIGLLMIYGTTSAEIIDRSLEKDWYMATLRQVLFGLIGLVLGGIFYITGYQKLLKHSHLLLWVVIGSLAIVFVPGIGCKINGAKRWISLMGFTFQPSEMAKYILPMILIKQILQKPKLSFFGFITLLLPFFLSLVLVILEPDNGTAAVMICCAMLCFFLLKVPALYWALPSFLVVVTAAGFAFHMPHVKSRLTVYLHPEQDLLGKGHQPYQAKIAAGSGRLTGRGIGESLQKMTYLPEARSDYIAAIYAEECGFIGILFLIGLYLAILFLGMKIALLAKDPLGFHIAAMITFLITLQAFVNLGVVSNLLPSKGTTLPFVSQGGSALMVSFAILGLLLSVSKQEKSYVKA